MAEKLSDKANVIRGDFLGRCRQSAGQGQHFCDTGSVVEDHAVKPTPVEDAYLFADAGEADAVGRYIHSALRDEAFTELDVQVEPIEAGDKAWRIRISAKW